MPVRILIADDHPLVRVALRHVLENAGPWEVLEAANGEEALELARTCHPDLVVLDLAMPVMDGFSAIAQIVKVSPGTPVLVHTLYYSPVVVRRALKAGAKDVIAKSDSARIVEAVRAVLPPESSDGETPEGDGVKNEIKVEPDQEAASETSIA